MIQSVPAPIYGDSWVVSTQRQLKRLLDALIDGRYKGFPITETERIAIREEVHSLRHELRQANPHEYMFDGSYEAWVEAGKPKAPHTNCLGTNCPLRTQL